MFHILVLVVINKASVFLTTANECLENARLSQSFLKDSLVLPVVILRELYFWCNLQEFEFVHEAWTSVSLCTGKLSPGSVDCECTP